MKVAKLFITNLHMLKKLHIYSFSIQIIFQDCVIQALSTLFMDRPYLLFCYTLKLYLIILCLLFAWFIGYPDPDKSGEGHVR